MSTSTPFIQICGNIRGRYLIVDYERSNFSISQSLFESNAPQQIIAISSANTTAPGITKTQQSSSFPIGAIIGIVVAIVVLALAGIVAFFFIRRRRRRRRLEEYERKKAEEFDPLAKPEMDGSGKPPIGELSTEDKSGAEMDSKAMTEMEGSNDGFYNAAKLHAEMEGSRGGAEIEGTKGGHEMHAGDVPTPVEMWAGPEGLFELPTPPSQDSRRPSPGSRTPSSSASGRPSIASRSDSNRRSSRLLSWGRRNQPNSSLLRNESSEVSSPASELPSQRESGTDTWSPRGSSRPTPPLQAATPQDISSPSSRSRERARRGDDLTRRLESSSRNHSTTHFSVSSPTSESSQDRWNTRFGTHLRESTASGDAMSPSSSDSRSRERRLPPIPSEPIRQEVVRSPEAASPRRGLQGRNEDDSWMSPVSESEPSDGIGSHSSQGRRDERTSGRFF